MDKIFDSCEQIFFLAKSVVKKFLMGTLKKYLWQVQIVLLTAVTLNFPDKCNVRKFLHLKFYFDSCLWSENLAGVVG